MKNTSLRKKSVEASFTMMTEYVLPIHANVLNGVFGGQILAWMDICAAICAQRHCETICVTAAVDELYFENPIKVGQVVYLEARILATFKSSLEIEVIVKGEEPATRKVWPCVRALMTFVAIDENRKPQLIPQLEVKTEQEKRNFEAALMRRKQRLSKRS